MIYDCALLVAPFSIVQATLMIYTIRIFLGLVSFPFSSSSLTPPIPLLAFSMYGCQASACTAQLCSCTTEHRTCLGRAALGSNTLACAAVKISSKNRFIQILTLNGSTIFQETLFYIWEMLFLQDKLEISCDSQVPKNLIFRFFFKTQDSQDLKKSV